MTPRWLPAIAVFVGGAAWVACDGDIQLGAPLSAPTAGGPDASSDSEAGDAAPDAELAPDRPYGSCAAEGECGLTDLHCELSRGACVQCRSNADCASGDRRFCDTGSGRCLGCRGDGDCDADDRCETAIHRCVERCSGIRPCAIGTCEEATGRCIECSPGTACGGRRVCATSAVCVECQSDADCAAAGEEPRCDPFLAQCVRCTSNADCPSAKRCDPARGECSSTSD